MVITTGGSPSYVVWFIDDYNIHILENGKGEVIVVDMELKPLSRTDEVYRPCDNGGWREKTFASKKKAREWLIKNVELLSKVGMSPSDATCYAVWPAFYYCDSMNRVRIGFKK